MVVTLVLGWSPRNVGRLTDLFSARFWDVGACVDGQDEK